MFEINFSVEELIASQSPDLAPMFPTLDTVYSTNTHNPDLNMSKFFNSNFSASEYGFTELWMRHPPGISAVFCVAYSIVFILGILGNSLVVSVVIRSPRMRTVTNYFIVNLALADILVVIFCLPATLLGNIFVRKYTVHGYFHSIICCCKLLSYVQ